MKRSGILLILSTAFISSGAVPAGPFDVAAITRLRGRFGLPPSV